MPITVVVTFYSREGETERLAHAAAVGAVQARALIRLRRVGDAASVAQAGDALRRMHREYVVPREADIVAADALVIASRPDVDASAPEWSPFVELLERLHAEGRLAGKTAAVVDTGASAASFRALVNRLGLATPPDDGGGEPDAMNRAVALGRVVAGLADSRRR